jgi:HSP20 family protein
MRVTDLIPWRSHAPAAQSRAENGDPYRALQLDINRAFDGFWQMFDSPLPQLLGDDRGGAIPMRVDISDSPDKVTVTAELPGLQEADIDVRIANGSLTIRAERKSEREAEEKGYVLRERSFGLVERTLPVPDNIDPNAAKAEFKNGVLTVSIPKTAEAQDDVKHVPVQTH